MSKHRVVMGTPGLYGHPYTKESLENVLKTQMLARHGGACLSLQSSGG